MTDYQPSKEVVSGGNNVRWASPSGSDLAQTNGQSAAHVDGEAQEASFKDNYIAPEDEFVDDAERNDASLGQQAQVAVGEVGIGKKKNKKKKSKSKRGLNAPSGFEEYYVDSPLTPAEAEEEQGLYHESLSFRQRIETAIQRYSAKRNLNSERKNIFDKWMVYGAVDAGPKMFSGGLDANTISNKTAAEIRTLTATHVVGQDKSDNGESDYVVDFEGVAKGFLSYHLPIQFDLFSHEAIKSKTNIIRNFLNYILHHDVCPEYKDQVYAAKAIVDQADKELWMISQASNLLPGRFNTACSELFGGQLHGLYLIDLADQEWAKGFPVVAGSGISPEMAKHTFKAGLIARGEQHVIGAYKKQSDAKKIKVISETPTGLEVTELLPAEPEVLELYQTPVGKGLKPLGRLRAKTWYYPGAPPEDLTEEEEAALAAAPKEIKEYELWVEDNVLALCFVGMKFITTIKELSFGILYFDELRGIYASFYQMLPNDLMIGWRKIEKTWLPMREKAEQVEEADDLKDGDEVKDAAAPEEVEEELS